MYTHGHIEDLDIQRMLDIQTPGAGAPPDLIAAAMHAFGCTECSQRQGAASSRRLEEKIEKQREESLGLTTIHPVAMDPAEELRLTSDPISQRPSFIFSVKQRSAPPVSLPQFFTYDPCDAGSVSELLALLATKVAASDLERVQRFIKRRSGDNAPGAAVVAAIVAADQQPSDNGHA